MDPDVCRRRSSGGFLPIFSIAADAFLREMHLLVCRWSVIRFSCERKQAGQPPASNRRSLSARLVSWISTDKEKHNGRGALIMVDEGIQLTLENLRCVAQERFFSALFQHLEHIAASAKELNIIALRWERKGEFLFWIWDSDFRGRQRELLGVRLFALYGMAFYYKRQDLNPFSRVKFLWGMQRYALISFNLICSCWNLWIFADKDWNEDFLGRRNTLFEWYFYFLLYQEGRFEKQKAVICVCYYGPKSC